MTTGLSTAADVASLFGLPLTLVQWYLAYRDSNKAATITEYLEYLRRQDQRELMAEIQSSNARQKTVQQQIEQLKQSFALWATDFPEKLSDLLLQNLFDFNTFRISEQDAAFEASYLAHLRNRYGRLRTLGVREMRELNQDLSLAYVSLNFSIGAVSGELPPIPAEILLAANPLLTIRGTAGSGKTTLLHWIALQCSKSRDSGSVWAGGIPFVLSLRALPEQAQGKPKGACLVDYSVDPDVFTATAPEGWLERVLQGKRAVLLIDGLDEISAAYRPGFWRWLEGWTTNHPGNRCYITSRYFADSDSAKSKGLWAPPNTFGSAQVEEMDDEDIRAFIERWHRAVSDTELDAEERRAIAQAGESLPARLFDPSNRRVRDLCRTPLLCALVCALHWREEGYLPARRIDLYDRCCKMLLEERDRKRNIKPPEGPLGRLSLGDKEMLLQRLAWQMMSNVGKDSDQRIEIDRDQAVRWLKPHLRSCDDVECRNCDAADVLNHLVDRTGLLREPAKGRIDFSHRTFQEYLAACAAGYYDDAVSLARRSMNDQWHETIVLAAGTPVGGSAFGNRLIEELLRRGTSLTQERARNLSLALALACLETGKQIKPELRAIVLEQLSKLVPPRSEVTARQLAVAGDALLPHLRYESVKASGWRAVALSAHAIARVETQRAREVLLDPNGYGGETRISVVTEICKCPLINTLEVPLIRSLLRERHPTVTSTLDWAIRIASSLSPLENDHELRFLHLRGNRRITSFAALSTLLKLETLNLNETLIDDRELSALRELVSLRELSLIRTRVTDSGLQNLQDLTLLRSLFLAENALTDAGLVHLRRLRSLRSLSLGRTKVTDTGLAVLQNFKSLRMLWLAGVQLTDAGMVHVENLTSLLRLSISDTNVTNAGLMHLANLTSLESLFLDGTQVTDEGLAHLRNLRSLANLSLDGTNVTHHGLANLRDLPSLRHLSLNRTNLTMEEMTYLDNLPSLRSVLLDGSSYHRSK
jgi:hypothetical protein